MKCPKCKSKNINVTSSRKVSHQNPVKECLQCGATWVCHGNKQVSFLFPDTDAQGVMGI